ncbi:hypothetical protein BV25DRAFT_1442758 [Artomyces pyxidatus]|uniref:Uncharacterized protein n=1 Tax=Artomyces pyxidatus TaxID=48021 RepID=A0ACB8SM00_9AGAM|nr:hypothetical protein BV25DRAFT_1442758 [Artomyces pyxidatus]
MHSHLPRILQRPKSSCIGGGATLEQQSNSDDTVPTRQNHVIAVDFPVEEGRPCALLQHHSYACISTKLLRACRPQSISFLTCVYSTPRTSMTLRKPLLVLLRSTADMAPVWVDPPKSPPFRLPHQKYALDSHSSIATVLPLNIGVSLCYGFSIQARKTPRHRHITLAAFRISKATAHVHSTLQHCVPCHQDYPLSALRRPTSTMHKRPCAVALRAGLGQRRDKFYLTRPGLEKLHGPS